MGFWLRLCKAICVKTKFFEKSVHLGDLTALMISTYKRYTVWVTHLLASTTVSIDQKTLAERIHFHVSLLATFGETASCSGCVGISWRFSQV